MPNGRELSKNTAEASDQGNGETSAKRRREPLTRQRIVGTGLRLMDEEGLEAVTMRRIGRELGVEAMSLYGRTHNHVRDKEDILDAITEMVMADFRFEPTSEDWVEQARAVAHEWRRMLKAHPNVITLMVERQHPMTSYDAVRPMEIALDVLRRAGLSEHDAVQAFRAVGGYIFGFVMMEVGNLVAGTGVEPEASLEEIARTMPLDRLPRVAELLPEILRCDNEVTFDFGLDLLLDGIRARAGRGPAS